MIEHLTIKNFLAFPELEVPELKLINLVAGKNGVGKTALLEAIQLYKCSDKIGTNRLISENRKGNIIHHKDRIFASKLEINNLSMTMAVGDYKSKVFIDGEQVEGHGHPDDYPNHEYEFIRSGIKEHDWISRRWSSFVLTEKEELVTEVISKVIGLNIFRIAVTDQSIMVKIAGAKNPVNIKSLGDGLMRTFQIAMALVDSKPLASNLIGLLLIDEIETHLHHSVIRKLWKIIFEYAIKWNIQVVATTHSQDAIRQLFYEAAANESYQEKVQVLRLQIGRSGKHEVIEYPYEKLEFMMDTKLEIRGL